MKGRSIMRISAVHIARRAATVVGVSLFAAALALPLEAQTVTCNAATGTSAIVRAAENLTHLVELTKTHVTRFRLEDRDQPAAALPAALANGTQRTTVKSASTIRE